MTKIYGEKGTSFQQIGGAIPNGNWVEMQSMRPHDGEWIADECGEWKPAVISSQEKTQQRITEIRSLLAANDLASVRPLRAKVAGTATEADDARLAELEAEAQALRTELATLSAE